MNSDTTAAPLLSIRCAAYNQADYIRQTLEGFVMQQTDFRFEAVVHDDASTDATASIIREFAAAHPSIIKPIYEEENLYSRHDGSLRRVMTAHATGKYIAMCEGDDYWTDPQKLQRQVDFLETHPDYTMVCCRARRYSERRQRFVSDSHCYDETRDVDTDDIILRGGLFISTCSIVYRRSVLDDYPDYAARCHVSDYPLQILCAMRGKVHYMDEPMCVYRIENNTSWVGRQKGCVTAAKVRGYVSEVEMLKGFAADHPAYAHVFERRIRRYILWVVPLRKSDPEGEKRVREAFADDIRRFPPMVRLLLWMAVRNKTLRRWQRSWGRRLGIA